MENKSLFAIEQELVNLFAQLEESGGEASPEIQEQLAITREQLKHKSLNYVHYIKKLEQDLELAKVYEEQVAAFKKRKQKTIERLKESLLDAAKFFGDIETEIFTIKTRKSESVEITDESALPMFVYKTETVRKIDKAKIKEAIKAGQQISGAEIRTNLNLSIK
jgi:hypothetical protein